MLFRLDWLSGPPPKRLSTEPTIEELLLQAYREKRKKFTDPMD